MSCRAVTRIVMYLSLSLLLAVTASSCGSSGKTVVSGRDAHASTAAATTTKKPSKPTHIPMPDELTQPASALLAEADKWIGTPYLWGGNDRNGVDCSGFVTQIYLKALGIKLPRTSKTQHEYCTPVDRNKLQPGDLVFFATTKTHDRVSHVGMYIGDGMMVHSSSSRGVVISGLNENYYTRTFFGAGRVEQFYAMVNNARTDTPKPATDDRTVASVKSTKKSPKVIKSNSKRDRKPAAPSRDVAKKNDKKSDRGDNNAVASNTKEKKSKTSKPKSAPVQTNKIVPARNNQPSDDRIAVSTSTADARAAFLNSIIEQKADSIFNR